MDKGVFEHLGKAGKDIFFIECTEKFRRDKDVFCRIESTDFVFIPLKLIPVFPPTAASTAPKSVVGMLMYLIPRLNVAAAKPPKSVTIPPPRLMSSEWRVAPFSVKCLHTNERFSIFLFVSLAGITICLAVRINSEEAINGKQYVEVCFIGENKTLVVMNTLYDFFQVADNMVAFYDFLHTNRNKTIDEPII